MRVVSDTAATVVQDGATEYGISYSPQQILLVGLKRGSYSKADRRGQELHWTKTTIDDSRLGDTFSVYREFPRRYTRLHSFGQEQF
jgi:hypothetical protein